MTAVAPETDLLATAPAADAAPAATAAPDDDVLAEVLVEEISIDGMCGVY